MALSKLLYEQNVLTVQKEASRLLDAIVGSLDVALQSDGLVQFTFRGDVELLDRLAVWGAGLEDDEDFADQEADSRDLAKLESSVDEVRDGTDRRGNASDLSRRRHRPRTAGRAPIQPRR